MAPPELNEDVTAEILLHIPPDEPADLVCASVVCKLWLRAVSDLAFLRRYRAFHRGAPLLGFFYDDLNSEPLFPGFVPTTAASSPLQPGHVDDGCARWVSDCRHGRVLLRDIGRNFLVWDPLSNHREKLQAPGSWSWYAYRSKAVVLCAMAGCDHSACHGGPFLVVCLSVDNANYTLVHVHVYKSESRSWCATTSAQLDCTHFFFDVERAALIGDGIYCTVQGCARILKYDLVEQHLSSIGMPYCYKDFPVLMQNDDGSLGTAGVMGSRLELWSTKVNAEGITGRVKRKVIKLEEILPVDLTCVQTKVLSFAEGVEIFFISTNVGAFTFELKSGKVRKVDEPRDYHCVTPFISFLTPDHGCSKWTK